VKEYRSIHDDAIRRFAEPAQREEETPAGRGRQVAQVAAVVVGLLILVLAVPALLSVGSAPAAPLPVAAPAPPTAAVAPTEAPTQAPAPTAAPAATEAPAGPSYSLLRGQIAAGWTPETRDLTVGGPYLPLAERQGASCRIRVVTGQTAAGVETADVWADCTLLEGR
jgi:hypothetical protein